MPSASHVILSDLVRTISQETKSRTIPIATQYRKFWHRIQPQNAMHQVSLQQAPTRHIQDLIPRWSSSIIQIIRRPDILPLHLHFSNPVLLFCITHQQVPKTSQSPPRHHEVLLPLLFRPLFGCFVTYKFRIVHAPILPFVSQIKRIRIVHIQREPITSSIAHGLHLSFPAVQVVTDHRVRRESKNGNNTVKFET